MALRAVLFDFGGVILTSPFDAFAHYESEQGLPLGFLRRVNSTNHHGNAWARLERSEIGIDEFVAAFEHEANLLGHAVDGRAVLALLAGEIRPEMVEAVRRCGERYLTGLLTNNVLSDDAIHRDVIDLFDVVVESSRIGVRKPEPDFYRIACDQLGIEPSEAVFLDDLGVNLKPARELGMRTIKVADPRDALRELEVLVGFPLA